MSIYNRRNAIMGFLAWEGAKMIAARKARSAVPSIDRETRRPNRPAIAAAVAAVASVAVVFFLRRRDNGAGLDN
jgi:hypothetical protein